MSKKGSQEGQTLLNPSPRKDNKYDIESYSKESEPVGGEGWVRPGAPTASLAGHRRPNKARTILSVS